MHRRLIDPKHLLVHLTNRAPERYQHDRGKRQHADVNDRAPAEKFANRFNVHNAVVYFCVLDSASRIWIYGLTLKVWHRLVSPYLFCSALR